MKTKLLKRIRSNIKYKFKDGKCYMLQNSELKEFDSVENMILEYYCLFTTLDGSLFDWDWHSIYFRYVEKLEIRKFNKI
jgi:hypothetical protein